MKKLTATLALLCTLAGANAQSIFNTNDSHVWYEFLFPSLNMHNYIHYYTPLQNADTTINTIIYKKKYRTIYDLNNVTTSPTKLMYCSRYDSLLKRVYVVFKDSVKENLHYDFNINVGDTLHNLTHFYDANEL
jgi:hypothetical protein